MSKKHEDAANRLEELIMQAKDMVIYLRANHHESYAMVYELRREIGYIVNTLGVGQPKHSSINWNDDSA